MATALAPSPQMTPPAVSTQTDDAPVRTIDSNTLRLLGQELQRLFTQYKADRLLAEQKWLRNLRQYLGIYDPDIEGRLPKGGSRAYPRITRVKCISMLSRVMNLMFPGNEKNWELGASPSAEMKPEDVGDAVKELTQKYIDGGQQPPPMSYEFVEAATQYLADKRAEALSNLIWDQLQEIGGDQTADFIALNRKVVFSGIKFGLGVLEGPYLREEKQTLWGGDGRGGFAPAVRTIRKPLYEFLPVWDFYPDFSAKTLDRGDGYFVRKILGRAEMRKLANRSDFFGEEVKKYIRNNPRGNYTPQSFETELKSMGTKAHVNEQRTDPNGKYEVIVWKGPVSAQQLMQLGVQVPEKDQANDVESEIWMVDGAILKADINAWRKMGCEVRTVHTFVFDEDDTSVVGNGLPNVCRDSQMSICAATRMVLDNASVTSGPNLEVNTRLMVPGQDLTSIEPWKIWYRDDDGLTQQFQAVRELKFDGHLAELAKIVEMFMTFADMETFVGPATGGDVQKQPSEPMRTAAGQSMVRGDAALPFKDIIRNFDFFTQSWILSLVHFNRKFNPAQAREGDYDVIARGATSLIAKEVRGMQTDILAQTLTPEDRDWIDEGKFIKQRMATRDMADLMLPETEAMRRRAERTAHMAEIGQIEKDQLLAEVKKTLAEAVKNVTQAQKNSAGADAANVKSALDVLQIGMNDGDGQDGPQSANSGAGNKS